MLPGAVTLWELAPALAAAAPTWGQKKGERGRDPLRPSSLAQAPTSTSISMEHGHIQVSGASVSLEAVVSVVSRRAVSNQDVVPGNAGAPIREGCDGVLWRWGACECPASHTWDGSEGAPGCVAEDTGAEAAEKRPRWPRWGGSQPRAACPSGGGPCTHLRQLRPRWLSWSWVRPDRALLTEETVEAPRVMRMRPLSSKRAVLL